MKKLVMFLVFLACGIQGLQAAQVDPMDAALKVAGTLIEQGKYNDAAREYLRLAISYQYSEMVFLCQLCANLNQAAEKMAIGFSNNPYMSKDGFKSAIAYFNSALLMIPKGRSMPDTVKMIQDQLKIAQRLFANS